MKPNHTAGKRLILLVVLAAAAALLLGCDLFVDHSVTELALDDARKMTVKNLQKYENLQTLDLTACEVTAEKYDELHAALPNCTIIWNVPLGGSLFDSRLTQITLPKVSAEELAILDYFPDLASVDATACDCYAALMSKSLERQDVAFLWSVPIGETSVSNMETTLDLNGATTGGAQALGEALAYLPKITSVDIRGGDVSGADAAALAAQYPNIAFLYTVDVFGVKADSSVTELDLTTAQISDEAALPDALAPFPALASVDLTGQTLSADTIAALTERYPNVTFAYTLDLFGQQISNSATELDLSASTFTSPEEVAAGLSRLPALTSCNLCGSGLTNEQMETLVSQFPNIKFVWYVDIGAWRVRTDIVAFSTANRKEFPDGAGSFTGKGARTLKSEDAAALKYCKDLVYLDLTNNRVTDLSFLSGLTNLRVLMLGNNKVADLAPVASLTNLEYLEIYINAVTDLSPLSGLANLAYLNCCRNAFTDVTPLMAMTQLKMLWIANNRQIEQAELDKLTAALPDCTVCTRTSDSTGEGWLETDLYKEFQLKAGLVKAEE